MLLESIKTYCIVTNIYTFVFKLQNFEETFLLNNEIAFLTEFKKDVKKFGN